MWFRTRDTALAASRGLATEALRRSLVGRLTFDLWLRSLVPGLAHYYAGYQTRAWMIGGAYATALLLFPISFGTEWSTIWLGILLSIHLASIVDLQIGPDQTFFERMILAPLIAFGTLALVYVPIIQLVNSQIFVRHLTQPMGQFATGDVIVFRRLAAAGTNARLGDVVLYDIGTHTFPIGDHRAFLVGGDRIDRIIAGPGSHVTWHDGQLQVDGQPSEWQPLGITTAGSDLPMQVHNQTVGHAAGRTLLELFSNWSVTVPAGCFCIIPSTVLLPDVPTGRPMLDHVGRDLAVVRADRILGRAWICSYPMAHWSWVH
ncbi:MAG TPA: S26 family signal peptidase [Pirellulales bacterium]|nr:S26 family signal peptidase [Pirellulales bacterium]